MNRRAQLAIVFASFSALFLSADLRSEERPPNVVLIFLDDSGWGDFQPFGTPAYKTPNVEKLAAEGCRFDNFYVPQAICSASRAALMTGCYPGRTKVFGAHPPNARGLDPKFATMGEVLQAAGYRTAVFGKWHIGDQPETRPPARGFHESSGLMYSNDMWEFHPGNPEYWGRFPLRYWKNGKVTIERVTKEHQPHLTTWYTEDAVEFIRKSKDRPFFVYVPHSMPHVPLFVSEKFKGKSGAGLYGDVMQEIDWSVGEIMKALEETKTAQNTVVLFTSDNGPWISYGKRAGTTPFREAKGTSFDGGVRSACILRYPGKIRAGTSSDRAFCSIDLLPTIVSLVGADLPKNPIDGKDVWSLISGAKGAKNPHEFYPISTGRRLDAVVSGDGRWKLHLPHSYHVVVKPGENGRPGKHANRKIELSLFDMKNDPYETKNVIAEHPKVAAKMRAQAEAHRDRYYQRPLRKR